MIAKERMERAMTIRRAAEYARFSLRYMPRVWYSLMTMLTATGMPHVDISRKRA